MVFFLSCEGDNHCTYPNIQEGGLHRFNTIHCLTIGDTTSAFVSQKDGSYQTDREPAPQVHRNSKQGRKREKNCSDEDDDEGVVDMTYMVDKVFEDESDED